MSIKGGVAVSATGVGALAGVPLAAVGASEMVEGGNLLKNTWEGKLASGYNPGRDLAQITFGDYGDTVYYGTALVANLAALSVKVPLIVGKTDGLEKTVSMFGSKLSGWENATYIPGVGLLIGQATNQAKSAASAVYGGVKTGTEFSEVEGKK